MKEPFKRIPGPDMDVEPNPIYDSYRIKPNPHPAFASSEMWLIFKIKATGARYYLSPGHKILIAIAISGIPATDYQEVSREDFAKAIGADDAKSLSQLPLFKL